MNLALIDYDILVSANCLINPEDDDDRMVGGLLNSYVGIQDLCILMDSIVLFDKVYMFCTQNEFSELKNYKFTKYLIDNNIIELIDKSPQSNNYLELIKLYLSIFQKYMYATITLDGMQPLLEASYGGNVVQDTILDSLISLLIRSKDYTDERLDYAFRMMNCKVFGQKVIASKYDLLYIPSTLRSIPSRRIEFGRRLSITGEVLSQLNQLKLFFNYSDDNVFLMPPISSIILNKCNSDKNKILPKCIEARNGFEQFRLRYSKYSEAYANLEISISEKEELEGKYINEVIDLVRSDKGGKKLYRIFKTLFDIKVSVPKFTKVTLEEIEMALSKKRSGELSSFIHDLKNISDYQIIVEKLFGQNFKLSEKSIINNFETFCSDKYKELNRFDWFYMEKPPNVP